MYYNRIYIDNFLINAVRCDYCMNELLLNNQLLPIVLDAGFSEKLPDGIQPVESADYHIMLYVTGGKLAITEDGINYNLKNGDVIFLRQNSGRTISVSGKSGIHLYYFFFYMEQERETIHELSKVYTVPKMLSEISGSILDIKIRDYAGYFQNPGELSVININTAFYDILAECIKMNREYHPFQNNLTDEIISYLKEYVNQPLNTRDMEKRFYLTYKYMGTAFKKSTGSTILEYHTGLRMKQALRLLTTTFYSIDEISRQLGYSDALYFSRVFKKHYKKSPQIYRKDYKKSQTQSQ